MLSTQCFECPITSVKQGWWSQGLSDKQANAMLVLTHVCCELLLAALLLCLLNCLPY